MIPHETIEVFTPLWYKTIFISFIVIASILVLSLKINTNHMINNVAWIIGCVLLFRAVMIHPYQFYLGKWSMQASIPLHLCSMSAIFSALLLFKYNQLMYEFLVLIGIAGAIISFITPEFTLGTEGLLFYEYYVSHGGIIVSGLFLTYVLGHRPRRGSWINIFLAGQLLVILVTALNWVMGANYMYTCERPIVDNPLIIGPWPYYFLGFEIIGLVVILISYYIFYKPVKNNPI